MQMDHPLNANGCFFNCKCKFKMQIENANGFSVKMQIDFALMYIGRIQAKPAGNRSKG